MREPLPQRPVNLDPLAGEMFDRFKSVPEATHLVVGGGVALNCYIAPRLTHDVDAWWAQGTAGPQRDSTVAHIRAFAHDVALHNTLTVSERSLSLNDVVSIELSNVGRTVFSFQVAPRTVELRPPHTEDSPFYPLALESIVDNLASKMTALVSRGAPRDFIDVRAVVKLDIAMVSELWDFWSQKNPGQDIAAAKAHVLQHLGAIELRRPLEKMDLDARTAALDTRSWVRTVLTRGAEHVKD